MVRVQLPAPLAGDVADRRLATALVIGAPVMHRAVVPGLGKTRYELAPIAITGTDGRPVLRWVAVERLARALPARRAQPLRRARR